MYTLKINFVQLINIVRITVRHFNLHIHEYSFERLRRGRKWGKKKNSSTYLNQLSDPSKFGSMQRRLYAGICLSGGRAANAIMRKQLTKRKVVPPLISGCVRTKTKHARKPPV